LIVQGERGRFFSRFDQGHSAGFYRSATARTTA
jgi:hypothetical protein